MSKDSIIIPDTTRCEGDSTESLNQSPVRKPKDTSKRTPQKSLVDFPAKPIQAKNKLFYGDNLEILRNYVKDESVDLCYIDPPFNSKRNYNQIYNNTGSEDKAQAQAFIDTWTWDEPAINGLDEILSNKGRVFTKQSIELMSGLEKVLGRGALLSYLIHMTLRIAEINRVLKPTGSFYLHCDPTSSHYLKIIIDSIFCSKGGEFLNEIVWCYSERGISKNSFNKKHDIILFYSKKVDNHSFNYKEIVNDYSESTIKKFKYKDEDGRPFRLRGRNVPEAGKLRRQTDIPLHLENEYTYRQYLDQSKGVLAKDWIEMPFINQAAKERIGYPTQKPEALLEIFIKASSNEGDVVLDAYCGCGTTVAVAERLNRKWIGIDITYQSVSLILKRLEDTFGGAILKNVELSGIPEDFKSAEALANKKDDRTRKEFEKWAVLTYSNNRAMINEKKGGDGGIDGVSYMLDSVDNKKHESRQIIFSVKSGKNLPPSVIRDLNGTIQREGAALGILISLYPADNLIKESKKYGNYHNAMLGQHYSKIEVVTIDDILSGRTMKIPTSLEVLKEAEKKTKDKQLKFDM